MNVAVIRGRLSRPAVERTLPSGDRVVNLELTVRLDGQPTDTVPIAWPDAPASAAVLDTDAEVVVVGRVKRRFFQAGGATQSRTEVVATTVVPATHARKVAAAMRRARESLEEDGG